MPREGVRGTLFFANEPDRHRSLLEQQTLSKEYQKKMKAILDQPDLRFQVAQTLDRWDTQDFRVDINWTDFEYSLQRNGAELIHDHTRYVVFENSGSLPLKIQNIKIDDSAQACSDDSGVLTVRNCRELMRQPI